MCMQMSQLLWDSSCNNSFLFNSQRINKKVFFSFFFAFPFLFSPQRFSSPCFKYFLNCLFFFTYHFSLKHFSDFFTQIHLSLSIFSLFLSFSLQRPSFDALCVIIFFAIMIHFLFCSFRCPTFFGLEFFLLQYNFYSLKFLSLP